MARTGTIHPAPRSGAFEAPGGGGGGAADGAKRAAGAAGVRSADGAPPAAGAAGVGSADGPPRSAGAAGVGPATPRPAVDRCPGILRLHDAGDGGLARVRVPGGRLDARALAALADGAALGNGLAELTSRASVQLRGLPDDAAAPLARLLAAGGLLPSRPHDRVRNVLASPVAGRLEASLLPTDALVDALDTALCADPALAALPGRFLFALDDGAGLVDVRASDVALVAEPAPTAPAAQPHADHAAAPEHRAAAADARFRLLLAGLPTALTVAPAEAVALLLRAAHAFLALRAETAPKAWHVVDLPDGPVALARALGTAPMTATLSPHTGARPAVIPTGSLAQADGLVAITALPPLARLERAQLAGLAELLREEGAAAAAASENRRTPAPSPPAPSLRIAPSRTLTLVDVAPDRAQAVAERLTALGLVLTPGSGWNRLTACSGMGACRRALIDVRSAAAIRATRRGPDAPAEHWSACERRCGMKRDVPIGVVAGETTLAVTRAGVACEAADVEHALELLDPTCDEGPAA